MVGLSFVFALLFFTSCTSFSAGQREPASQPETAETKERNEKNDFYLALIPSQYHKKLNVKPSDMPGILEHCRQSDYGKWMAPTSDATKLAERQTFLIQKANRPFYFYEVSDANGSSHFVGRIEDFREIICFSTALNNGLSNELGLPGKNNLEPAFFAKVMAQPDVNFALLKVLVPAWSSDARDSRTALLFANLPQSDVYITRDMLREAFKSDFPVPIRAEIFNKFFESKIFRAQPSNLSPLLLALVSHLSSSHEIFMLANLMLVKAGNLVNSHGLLSASVERVDSSQDYSDFFGRATGALPGDVKSMANIDNKISMLLELLNSSAIDSSSEADFLNLWKQKPSAAGRKALLDYAMNFEKSSQRLSASAISKVGLDTIEADAKDEVTIEQVLAKLYGQKGLTFDSRLHLFEKICDGQDKTATLAKTLILTGETLAHENSKVEVEISPCVRQAGIRFANRTSDSGSKDDRVDKNKETEVLKEYSNYIIGLEDHLLESSLANEILTNPHLEESFLVHVASDTHNLTNAMAGTSWSSFSGIQIYPRSLFNK